MTNSPLEDILDSALKRLRNGERLADVLASHPAERTELEPLLRAAETLQRLPRTAPCGEALHRAIFQMGAEAAELRRRTSPPYIFRTWLARAAVALLSLVIFGYGAATVADGSLPGQTLYPLKLATERIRLNLTRDPEGKAELRITLSEKRLQEVVASAERGRMDQAVLDAMLSEAGRALDDLDELPQHRQEYLLERVGTLSGRQRRALEELKPITPPQDQPLLDTAIRTCMDRWNWWTQQQSNPVAPGQRKPRQMMRQWQDMCPMWDR